MAELDEKSTALYQPMAKDARGDVAWIGPGYESLGAAIVVAAYAAHRYGITGMVVRIPVWAETTWPVPRPSVMWEGSPNRSEPVQ